MTDSISEQPPNNNIPSQSNTKNQMLASPGSQPPSQADISKLFQDIENLKTELGTQDRELKKGLIDVKDSKDLVHLGFLILLVMVALAIITSWGERTKSYNNLIEKVYSLQNQIQELDKR